MIPVAETALHHLAIDVVAVRTVDRRQVFSYGNFARLHVLPRAFRERQDIIEEKPQVGTAIIGDIGVELLKQLGSINPLSIVPIKML
jgi:hypothetical protein